MTNSELLQAMASMLDEKIEPINRRLDNLEAKFEVMDERLDKLEAKFEVMNERLDKLETKFEVMDERLDKLETRIERLDKRFDSLESRVQSGECTLRDEIKQSGTLIFSEIERVHNILYNHIQDQTKHIA